MHRKEQKSEIQTKKKRLHGGNRSKRKFRKHLMIIIPRQQLSVKYRILRFWTAAVRACARA